MIASTRITVLTPLRSLVSRSYIQVPTTLAATLTPELDHERHERRLDRANRKSRFGNGPDWEPGRHVRVAGARSLTTSAMHDKKEDTECSTGRNEPARGSCDA